MNIVGSELREGEQQGRGLQGSLRGFYAPPPLDSDIYIGALGTRLHHPWVKLVPITPEAAFSLLKSVKDIAPKIRRT